MSRNVDIAENFRSSNIQLAVEEKRGVDPVFPHGRKVAADSLVPIENGDLLILIFSRCGAGTLLEGGGRFAGRRLLGVGHHVKRGHYEREPKNELSHWGRPASSVCL